MVTESTNSGSQQDSGSGEMIQDIPMVGGIVRTELVLDALKGVFFFYPFLMIISWNCRGCASTKFISICNDLVHSYKPIILILFETSIAGVKADKVIRKLGF